MAVSLNPRSTPVDASWRMATDDRRLALEVELLLTGLAELYGCDFRHYARPSLTRRICRAAQLEGVSSLSALQSKLLHDEEVAMRFVASLAVHTTAMFRDPSVYQALRAEVVPRLRTHPFVRIWHAGCSSGEEAYSLAILLEEAGLYERCRIYATDLSDAVLERARLGIVPLRAMQAHTRSYQRAGGRRDFSSYYAAYRHDAVFRRSLRRHIVFSQHDLAADSRFNEFHLVVCRNVLLYFDDTLRDHVLEMLHASLARYGVLVLGKEECLTFTRFAELYREVGESTRIYRRLD
jgi:chemotaxis protein methyltransferase CheR